MVLVDMEAKCTLIHGNPQKFSCSLSTISGYRGETVMVRKTLLTLQVGYSPLPHPENEVFITLTPENILGIDILLGQILEVSIGEVHPRVRVITPVLRENTSWTLGRLLPS